MKRLIFRALPVFLFMNMSVVTSADVPEFLSGAEDIGMQQSLESYAGIAIHDRVLFKIHEDQVVTTLDVIRKLNLLFYSSYPELVDSVSARSEYYATMWPVVLESVIDEFLMVADAAEKKIYIDPTIVNQEIEEMFGKDLSVLCTHFDMTPQDVYTIMHRTLLAQKVMSMMVRSKVMLKVTPARIREQYQKIVEEASRTRMWKYRVIRIEAPSSSSALYIANKVQKRLNQDRSWDENRLSAFVLSLGGTFHCSDELVRNDREVSEAHKVELKEIAYPDMCCGMPKEHKTGYRMFVVFDCSTMSVKPLEEMETQIKHAVFAADAKDVEAKYRDKLRLRYGYNPSAIAQLMSEEAPPLFSLLS